MYDDRFLDRLLEERKSQGLLRALGTTPGMIDFCSNDYLGISTNKLLNTHVPGQENHGSGGSRVLSGNYPLIEEAEKMIAGFHKGEASLIFNSGYSANIGLLGCIAQKGDTILYDQYSHASIREGIRLSFAAAHSFRHNDVNELEKKMRQANGKIFVVTESVFSMDGHICPLEQLVSLCERFQAHLIIDEAHAIGVIGQRGEGLAQHLQLENRILARIYTFGKAPGCHGAAIVGSDRLRLFLVNFARSFVYTTALPEVAVRAIIAAYQVFPTLTKERQSLTTLIEGFRQADLPYEKLDSVTPIQGVIIPGNEDVIQVAKSLQSARFDVRAIRYPTVARGRERLRINLHAFNSVDQLQHLIDQLTRVKF